MSDLSEIQKAIEASNAAFAEFKSVNDAKLEELSKGGTTSEHQAKIAKIQADMAEQKALIETLEAKAKRPNFGSDGKPVDADAVEHQKAFGGYVRKGTEYSKEIEAKSLNIGANDAGGFAVPKVIDGMIETLLVNVSPIRSIASVQQISTSDFHKLVNKRGTSSGWVGETQARSETTAPLLADVAPPMGELYANPMATQQMLDDVFFNAESWLADNIATEFARGEGAAFVSGTGVNQPLGLLSATNVATADATRAFGSVEYLATGASGAFKTLSSTVNPADDLFTVVGKLKAGYRAGSNWLMNKNTLFAIMAFKDYQGRYVFNPASQPGVQDTILGYPVVEAEDMPDYTTASAMAIAFGNFKRGYLIVDRIGTRVLRDPFSNKPYVGFYTTKRLGGGIVNSEAIKLVKFYTS